MNKEQIESLISFLNPETCKYVSLDNAIKSWFENNTVANTIGLSTKQVKSLACTLSGQVNCDTIISDYSNIISSWQETQQFDVPTNEPVGLSGEQIEQLGYELFQFNEGFFAEFEDIPTAGDHTSFIKDWMKYEEFHTQNILESGPNWDLAPEWATKASIKVHWSNSENYEMSCDSLGEFESPKPAVGVGSVWIHTESGNSYKIKELTILDGKTKINGWQDNLILVAYTPLDSDKIYRRLLDDFLEKFERG